MINPIEVPCEDCPNIRIVKANGMLSESYIKKNPVCRSCGAKRVKDKISKGWFKKGVSSWNKGKTKDFKECSSDLSSLHKWINRNWNKPDKCEKCKSNNNIEWANKSHKYLRLKEDWFALCKKCHNKYDYEKFNIRKKFYE